MQGIDADLIRRVARVTRVNRAKGAWSYQREHRGDFPVEKRRAMTDADIADALAHVWWLGSMAARNPSGAPVTDRIAFDIDCRGPEHVDDRDRRYWAIRRLMGREREPLVYRTPSGYGLRVAYRIPEVALTDIVTGLDAGLVPDVLRAAQIPVVAGQVEVFPQAAKPDRVMLGRRMPFLDPETLTQIGDPPIGDGFSAVALHWALEHVERWYDAPDATLLEHLRQLPAEPRIWVAEHGEHAVRREDEIIPLVRRDTGELLVSPDLDRLVRVGLTRPSSRHACEFLVAIAFLCEPTRWAEFGLSPRPSTAAIATATATWLEWRHNGKSDEWTTSCGEHRDAGARVAAWTKRYLKRPAGGGGNMVERAAAAIRAVDPMRRTVAQLTDAELARIHALVERRGVSGAARYRAEIWIGTLIRFVKHVIQESEERGQPLHVHTLADGRRVVRLRIAASHMEAWPYGKSESAGYCRYRTWLIEEGWMSWAAAYRSPSYLAPGDPAAVAGYPTTYRVLAPDPSPDVRALGGVSPTLIRRALSNAEGPYARERYTLLEAYHALWAVRTGVSLTKAYGRKTRERIEAIVAAVETARPAAMNGLVACAPKTASVVDYRHIAPVQALRATGS